MTTHLPFHSLGRLPKMAAFKDFYGVGADTGRALGYFQCQGSECGRCSAVLEECATLSGSSWLDSTLGWLDSTLGKHV